MNPVSSRFIRLAERTFSGRQPVICDVGSRDAKEGIYLLEKLNALKLHVFEPNPEAATICRHNLRFLPSAKVSFNELAVTNQITEAKFYPVVPSLSDTKDIGFSSLFPINPKYTKRRGRIVQDEIIVKTTTLDSYFSGQQPPDLLWIDVEGAELQALQGAVNVLKNVKLIHIEVSFRPMQIGKPLFREIEQFLNKLDFRLYRFMEISAFKSYLVRHGFLPNPPWRLNAVFTPVKHKP